MIGATMTDADFELLTRSGSRIIGPTVARMSQWMLVSISVVIVGVYTLRISTPVILGAVSLGVLVVMVVATRHHVASRLERARRDMDMALAVVIDLVNVLLAGGAGVETALVTAVSVGDGWSFEQLRAAISRAQSARQPYWSALNDLGEQLDIGSLRSVGQSLRIATEHGGRIRQSLVSRADALRTQNLARLEHDAERRTERMGVPMVLMFVSFVLFIGYPAFASTLGSL